MSTDTVIPTPAPRPASHTISVVVGSVLAIIGAVLALAGGGLFAIFGSDGSVSSGREAITSPTTALVSSAATIQDTADVTDVLGAMHIRVTADEGTFVGVAPAADVDRYLAGAAIEKITDFDVDPFKLERSTVAGSATPGRPAAQDFWVAQGSNGQEMDWKIKDGSYRVVIMNTDGSRDVSTNAEFEVEIPFLPEIGLGVLLFGLAILGASATTIVLGTRRR